MSDQDYEELDDLWTAMSKAATSGHRGPNSGRIHDGCLFVTQREWDLIKGSEHTRNWDELSAAEKLSQIPIRIMSDGGSEKLSDGRILFCFKDTIYLMPVDALDLIPPSPRLHIDGMYI